MQAAVDTLSPVLVQVPLPGPSQVRARGTGLNSQVGGVREEGGMEIS